MDRPSIGGNRPGAGGDRPTTLPGNIDRPTIGGNRPGAGGDRPTTLPGNIDRPTIGGNRPGAGGDRPTTLPGNIDRPTIGGNRPGAGGDRPTTLPGNIDRPTIGGNRPNGNRPGNGGDRPTTLPGINDRPIIGGNRPGGGGNRPGNWPNINDRPVIGGNNNNNIINRPGGNHFGDNNFNNININNNNFIRNNNWNNFNRPGWGYGWNRPWNDQWRDHCINYHHSWYHGCWGGSWGAGWYANRWWTPGFAAAATLPLWGYSYAYTYTNPYVQYYTPVVASQPAYDYSQPVVINTYNVTQEAPDAAAQPDTAAKEPPEASESFQVFDQAREAFAKGDYRRALQLDEQAIQKTPSDSVLHEFAALCSFALGDYGRAAAVLNSLLAVAPGMDWTTMSSLYTDVDEYTKQLRALEAHCKSKPDDAAALFVLAYHYLVTGQNDPAIRMLQRVVQQQPSDMVSKQLLDSLSPQQEVAKEPPKPPAPGESQQPAASATEPAATDEPSTDLVGNWRAEREGDVFELTIDEQGGFTWKATPKGKDAISVAGTVATTSDTLVLDSKEQGSMVGRVTSGGADKFQFVSVGSPPDDKGLEFKRT